MYKPLGRDNTTRRIPLLPSLCLSHRISHTRWRTCSNLTWANTRNTPLHPLRLLPLQFLKNLLHIQSLHDLLGRSRQYSQHSETTVFLVLLESAPQVLLCDSVIAHALPGLGEFGQSVLACQVAGTEDCTTDGEVGPVAAEPAAGGLYHFVWW